MGLIFAKHYLKNMDANNQMPMHYQDKIYMLKINEIFLFNDDDYLEVTYTGDEIKLSYRNEDYIETTNVNGKITFKVIESVKNDYNRKSMIYPLSNGCSSICIERYTVEDYKKLKNSTLSLYMEYRD